TQAGGFLLGLPVPPAELEYELIARRVPGRCDPGALAAREVGIAELKLPLGRYLRD
ncbi:MAG: hypothetical protein JO181_08460, partial [Solirubrobacterales bacterium]|nr:hypothetical protein [Solirubrobacterales bacterium]